MQLRKVSSPSTTGMALLCYLQVLPRGQLPDPVGVLSSSVPSSAIAEANVAVIPMLGTKKRLQTYKGEERAK